MNNEYPITPDAPDAENEQVHQPADEAAASRTSVPEQTDAAQNASADADRTAAQTADAPANEEQAKPTDNPYAQGQQFRREKTGGSECVSFNQTTDAVDGDMFMHAQR